MEKQLLLSFSDSSTEDGANVSSHVLQLWQQAVARYEKSTHSKISTPQDFDFKDTKDLAERVVSDKSQFDQYRHPGSRADKIRTAAKGCLESVITLTEICANTSAAAFPPAQALFVVLSGILKSADKTSKQYDLLEAVFDDLDQQLGSLQILEKKLPILPQLREDVIIIFIAVLVVSEISTNYIRKRRVRIAAKFFFGPDEKMEAAKAQLARAVESARDKIASLTLVNVLDTTEDVKRIGSTTHNIEEKLSDTKAAEEAEKILQWLSPLNDVKKQQDAFDKRHDQTGDWLLKRDDIDQWMNGPENTTIWGCGIPGAGKTVMTSIMIKHIEDCLPNDGIAVAFVYCDYRDPHTAIEIFASIARQMSEYFRKYWSRAIPPKVSDFYQAWYDQKSRPSLHHYTTLVSNLTTLFPKVFICIDALDELDGEALEDVVSSLESSDAPVRYFITSRETVNLASRVKNTTKVDIRASEVDTRAYLQHAVTRRQLGGLTRGNDGLRTEIIEKIQANTSGMFLLVTLQIALLRSQPTIHHLRSALVTLPQDVSSFYEQSMGRINQQGDATRNLAKRALSFIFCAKRTLKRTELFEALSLDEGDKYLNVEKFPIEETLLGICKGLIRIDKTTDTISLVHTTLSEYFQANMAATLGDPDEQFARICITYLMFDEFSDGPCESDEALFARWNEHAFLAYAVRHLGPHARAAEIRGSEAITRASMNLLKSGENLAAYVQLFYAGPERKHKWHESYPRQFGPLHAAVLWGLEGATETLLREDLDVESRDGQGNTPMHIAAANGNIGALKFLFGSSAQVQIANVNGQSPLILAAQEGLSTVIVALLLAGADIQACDQLGMTALDWAIVRRHCDSAVILGTRSYNKDDHAAVLALIKADRGQDQESELRASGHFKLSTPLSRASGRLDETRELLEAGEDPNTGMEGEETLISAHIDKPEVVKLALKHGGDPSKEVNQKTPLQKCAEQNHFSTARLLLDEGASPNKFGKSTSPPLNLAVVNGYEDMVQLLLDGGGDPNISDKDGWKPLHIAYICGQQEIIAILQSHTRGAQDIEKDISQFLEDELHQAWLRATVLEMRKESYSELNCCLRKILFEKHTMEVHIRWAFYPPKEDWARYVKLRYTDAVKTEDHLSKVQTLIDKGEDVNALQEDGQTPLSVVCFMSQMEHVEEMSEKALGLLLDNGAKINLSTSRIVSTPLLAAIWVIPRNPDANENRAARYLVQRGADVKKSNVYGFTPLHMAAWLSGQGLMVDLLSHGALVNAEDLWGGTPLTWCIWGRKNGGQKTWVIALLMQHGADIHARMRYRRCAFSCLHMAVLRADLRTIRVLLEAGADVNACVDGLGINALDMARVLKFPTVEAYLIHKGATYSPVAYMKKAQELTLSRRQETRQLPILSLQDVETFGFSPKVFYKALLKWQPGKEYGVAETHR